MLNAFLLTKAVLTKSVFSIINVATLRTVQHVQDTSIDFFGIHKAKLEFVQDIIFETPKARHKNRVRNAVSDDEAYNQASCF